jgi:hypothetical protein
METAADWHLGQTIGTSGDPKTTEPQNQLEEVIQCNWIVEKFSTGRD